MVVEHEHEVLDRSHPGFTDLCLANDNRSTSSTRPSRIYWQLRHDASHESVSPLIRPSAIEPARRIKGYFISCLSRQSLLSRPGRFVHACLVDLQFTNVYTLYLLPWPCEEASLFIGAPKSCRRSCTPVPCCGATPQHCLPTRTALEGK